MLDPYQQQQRLVTNRAECRAHWHDREGAAASPARQSQKIDGNDIEPSAVVLWPRAVTSGVALLLRIIGHGLALAFYFFSIFSSSSLTVSLV